MTTQIVEAASDWLPSSPVEIAGSGFTPQQGTAYVVFPQSGMVGGLRITSWSDTKIAATLPRKLASGQPVYLVVQGSASSPFCVRSGFYTTAIPHPTSVPPITPGTIVTVDPAVAAGLDVQNASNSPSLVGTCRGLDVETQQYRVEWYNSTTQSLVPQGSLFALGAMTLNRGRTLGSITTGGRG